MRFNSKIISNKTKDFDVQKNDDYQNMFVYQPTLDTIELKKKIQRYWLCT